MNLIELHNYFRVENNLRPLIEDEALRDYAKKASHWMGRRNWSNFWNFDRTRVELLKFNFTDIDFNIAVGNTEEVVMKHLLNNLDKKSKIYASFTHVGYAYFDTNYRYWAILYGKITQNISS